MERKPQSEGGGEEGGRERVRLIDKEVIESTKQLQSVSKYKQY
jgi:hypothetical protein